MNHFHWCFDDLADDLKNDSERLRAEPGVHPVLKAARTPTDIAHWRRVFFHPKDAVVLDIDEYRRIWPYCDNYWTLYREEQKSVHFRCRMFRATGYKSVKTAEPEKQRQKLSTRTIFGCPCKIVIEPVRAEASLSSEIVAYRIQVSRDTEHNHTAEEIEPLKMNSAIMGMAGRLVDYDIPPPDVRRRLLCDHDPVAQQHFFDAGGKWLTLQTVKNASRQWQKVCSSKDAQGGKSTIFRTRRHRVSPSEPPATPGDLDDFFLGPKISTAPSPRPSERIQIVGKYVTLQGLSDEDVPSLWRNLDSHVYQYLPMLRQNNLDDFRVVFQGLRDRGMVLFAIKADPNHMSPTSPPSSSVTRTETVGTLAFLDIQPEHRALEVGAVLYGPALRRTPAATEAQYLLLLYAFGQAPMPLSPPYRRVVWKCNQRNVASRRAAERLGFTFEGTFRKHMIMCERSRDSEFFSMLDDEWNGFVRASLEMWLDAENFGADGKQIQNLESFRALCRSASQSISN
jgi:RimJ/RimL family protein N-acetyltransferase/cell wall assembly regulator SMI1